MTTARAILAALILTLAVLTTIACGGNAEPAPTATEPKATEPTAAGSPTAAPAETPAQPSAEPTGQLPTQEPNPQTPAATATMPATTHVPLPTHLSTLPTDTPAPEPPGKPTPATTVPEPPPPDIDTMDTLEHETSGGVRNIDGSTSAKGGGEWTLEDDAGGRGRKHRPHSPGRIPQAGETDDNALRHEYLEYARAKEQTIQAHPAYLTERYIIQVRRSDGKPLHGATVTLTEMATGTVLQVSKTHADGRTIYHPGGPQGMENSITVTATSNGRAGSTTGIVRKNGTTTVNLAVPATAPPTRQLDVMFLLDATGSMRDDIAKIKSTLTYIARGTRGLPGNPGLRLLLLAYRDRGDAFITQHYEFDTNPGRFSR